MVLVCLCCMTQLNPKRKSFLLSYHKGSPFQTQKEVNYTASHLLRDLPVPGFRFVQRDPNVYYAYLEGGDKRRPVSRIKTYNYFHRTTDQVRNAIPSSRKGLPDIQIDRLYYINLEHRWIRRGVMEHFMTEFSTKTGIPHQRVLGQRGQNNTCVFYKQGRSCVGISGLAKTNVDIIETLNTTGITMVLEDDFVVTPEMYEKLLLSVKLIPDDWDIIRWDCWDKALTGFQQYTYAFQVKLDQTLIDRCEQGSQGKGRNCHHCGGTHVMMYRGGESAQKLRKLWGKKPYNDIDCRLGMDPSLKSYCIQVGIGKFHMPDGEHSDIQKQATGKKFN